MTTFSKPIACFNASTPVVMHLVAAARPLALAARCRHQRVLHKAPNGSAM
jgi:hypothetical protein